MKLKDKLDNEIDWRITEMALIKTNHKTCNISDKRRQILLKYSSVEVYALLEGFVSKAFAIYVEEINKLNLHRKVLQESILSEYLQQKMQLFNERKYIDKKINLIVELEKYYELPVIMLSRDIHTGGNINLKSLNCLLKTYCILQIENKEIEKGLNKLLMFRNSIAHGEIGLIVDDEILTELIYYVTLTIDYIRDNIIYSFQHELFKR